MALEKIKSSTGKKQVSRVMKVFSKGRLRSKSGETVTDPEQAKAIAMGEGRAAEERGVKKRSWMGRTRIRPRLKD
jgi:hypothetical protein